MQAENYETTDSERNEPLSSNCTPIVFRCVMSCNCLKQLFLEFIIIVMSLEK